MIQTIIVFILFLGIVIWQGIKFFKKDKSADGDCGCSGCGSSKKSTS